MFICQTNCRYLSKQILIMGMVSEVLLLIDFNINLIQMNTIEEMDGISYPYSYVNCNPIINQTKKQKVLKYII